MYIIANETFFLQVKALIHSTLFELQFQIQYLLNLKYYLCLVKNVCVMKLLSETNFTPFNDTKFIINISIDPTWS